MESVKYAKLCLDAETKKFFMHKSSVRHHNKSYDNENYNKKQKFFLLQLFLLSTEVLPLANATFQY